MAEQRHFAVRLVRSGAGRKPDQRRTLTGLGLTKLGKTIYLKDTPPVRGMLYKIVHLVSIEPREGPPPPSKREKARAAASARASA